MKTITRPTKAERNLALAIRREAVLRALNNACRLTRDHKSVGMDAKETREYALFLVNLNAARARLTTNLNASDTGFKTFLPNGSMRNALGYESVSEFIVAPLEGVKRAVQSYGMELPLYVEYLHPDYREEQK